MVWARYRRVTAAGACSFCLMLASRGAVYSSEEMALRGHRVSASGHDHCNCSAELETDPDAADAIRIDPSDALKVIRTWSKRGKTAEHDLSRFRRLGVTSPPKATVKPPTVPKIKPTPKPEPAPEPVIRSVDTDDASDLAGRVVGDDPRADFMRRALGAKAQDAGSEVLVETDGAGVLRGAIALTDRPEAVFVEALGSQAPGAGTRLLRSAAEVARRRGKSLQLEPTAGSHTFYERLGLVEDPDGVGSPFMGISLDDLDEFIRTGRVSKPPVVAATTDTVDTAARAASLVKADRAIQLGKQRMRSKATTKKGRLSAAHDAIDCLRVAQAHFREAGVDQPVYLQKWVDDLESLVRDLNLLEGP